MAYKCTKCGEEIDKMPEGIIRCPVCAHKVMSKRRDNVAKEIRAR